MLDSLQVLCVCVRGMPACVAAQPGMTALKEPCLQTGLSDWNHSSQRHFYCLSDVTAGLVIGFLTLAVLAERVEQQIRQKQRLDREWERTKKYLLFPIAHEVSDDTSVCLWLISMANVSTTNTLLKEKASKSSKVHIHFRTVSVQWMNLVTREPLKTPLGLNMLT